MSPAPAPETILDLHGIVNQLGTQTVHRGLDLQIRRGELVALIGGSGTGKSVLLRTIVGLHRATAGRIRLLGQEVTSASSTQLAALRRRLGMMFQDGALFSSLDVAANVAAPLREHTRLPADLRQALVQWRLSLAGLAPHVGSQLPSELSGGMRKRAALARALALEPELLLLDEPTSGLDPITARAFDQLLQFLNQDLGMTVIMVTHDLDTLLGIAQRVVVLSQGHILADGPLETIMQHPDPWLQSYFGSRCAGRTPHPPAPSIPHGT